MKRGRDASGLTKRQLHILAMVAVTVDARGYPPSVREIGAAVGLTSTSAVAYQLEKLEAKGFLRRDPGRMRAITILKLPA